MALSPARVLLAAVLLAALACVAVAQFDSAAGIGPDGTLDYGEAGDGDEYDEEGGFYGDEGELADDFDAFTGDEEALDGHSHPHDGGAWGADDEDDGAPSDFDASGMDMDGGAFGGEYDEEGGGEGGEDERRPIRTDLPVWVDCDGEDAPALAPAAELVRACGRAVFVAYKWCVALNQRACVCDVPLRSRCAWL